MNDLKEHVNENLKKNTKTYGTSDSLSNWCIWGGIIGLLILLVGGGIIGFIITFMIFAFIGLCGWNEYQADQNGVKYSLFEGEDNPYTFEKAMDEAMNNYFFLKLIQLRVFYLHKVMNRRIEPPKDRGYISCMKELEFIEEYSLYKENNDIYSRNFNSLYIINDIKSIKTRWTPHELRIDDSWRDNSIDYMALYEKAKSDFPNYFETMGVYEIKLKGNTLENLNAFELMKPQEDLIEKSYKTIWNSSKSMFMMN